MIINLFSIFDPTSSFNLSLNWFSLFIPLIMLPLPFWLISSRYNLIFLTIVNKILKEILNNVIKTNFSSIIIIIRIFWFIIFRNLFGLYPYIFTSTSHINITLYLALPIWICLITYGWLKLTNNIFSHLVPLGTPIILSFFIVIIETIRNFIRPFTLSIRLTANIIAGHLLISLLRQITENNINLTILIIPILSLLIYLEYAVAIIQRFVFITLTSLYINEIN